MEKLWLIYNSYFKTTNTLFPNIYEIAKKYNLQIKIKYANNFHHDKEKNIIKYNNTIINNLPQIFF